MAASLAAYALSADRQGFHASHVELIESRAALCHSRQPHAVPLEPECVTIRCTRSLPAPTNTHRIKHHIFREPHSINTLSAFTLHTSTTMSQSMPIPKRKQPVRNAAVASWSSSESSYSGPGQESAHIPPTPSLAKGKFPASSPRQTEGISPRRPSLMGMHIPPGAASGCRWSS